MQSTYKKIFLAIIILILIQTPFLLSQILYKNQGISHSNGSEGNGSLTNAYKISFKGKNYSYFSGFSYFILGRAYMNHKIFFTIKNSFKRCENEIPGIKFMIMECSKKKGGSMWPHRSHQNGLGIDFMIPLDKKGKQNKFYDKTGVFHYALSFDKNGCLKINKRVKIDFENLANFLLILDEEAQKNGLKINKVILKLNLKDNLFATKSGKELQKRGIYFARYLPDKIDKLHDDHVHVDFIEI